MSGIRFAVRQRAAIADGTPQTYPTNPVKSFLFASLVTLSQLAAFGQDAPATPEKISLWSNHAPVGDGTFQAADATITVHRAAKPNGAALVICPGGGYGGLVTGAEGHGIAQWLNKHGITGVVLEYRLPKGNAFVPLLDAQRAIRTVRARAAQWEIDPKRIGIIGFSAGGHLASTAGRHFDAGDPKATDATGRASCRPDFMILVYPVISLGEKGHQGSRDNLLGAGAKPELVELFSNEKRVTRETPPAFLAHALDDNAVLPENSRMFYEALKASGVETKYLELQSGGHGLNGYKGPSWDAWQSQSLEWLAALKIIPAADVAVRRAEWPALEWKKGAPSAFVRVESPTAVVDGKLYLFGGFTDDLGASNEVDVYNPAADAWTRLKDMPTHVTHLNPAIDGGTIWFAGGFKGKHPGPVTDEVWKYEITSDSWSAGPPLPEPRGGGGLAIVGRKLHYFGGYKPDRDTNASEHWSLALDGGKEWQREADPPTPRGHVAAAVLDGRIYALGGAHGHDKTQNDLNACECFDPATGKWREIAGLPDGRSHFEGSTFIRKGRIVVVGGRCNSSKPLRNVVGDILEYDPKADAWSVVGTMPENVLAPSAAIVAGRLVVTGGGLNSPRPLTAATWIASISGTE